MKGVDQSKSPPAPKSSSSSALGSGSFFLGSSFLTSFLAYSFLGYSFFLSAAGALPPTLTFLRPLLIKSSIFLPLRDARTASTCLSSTVLPAAFSTQVRVSLAGVNQWGTGFFARQADQRKCCQILHV